MLVYVNSLMFREMEIVDDKFCLNMFSNLTPTDQIYFSIFKTNFCVSVFL